VHMVVHGGKREALLLFSTALASLGGVFFIQNASKKRPRQKDGSITHAAERR